MAKRLLSSDRLVALGSAVGAGYIRLAYNTSTVRRDPPDTDTKLFAEHPQIFAMWHGQFGMLPKIKPDRPADVAAMVARHGDAELIAGVLSRFGMRLIRGAGARLPAPQSWRGGRAAGSAQGAPARHDRGHDRRRRSGPCAQGRKRHRHAGEALRAPDRALRHGDEPLRHAQQLERLYHQPALLQAWHRGRRSDMGA